MNAPFRTDSTLERARLRVEDFLTLHEAGAFDGYAKAELIDGEIWVMNAIRSQHGLAQFEMAMRIRMALKAQGSDLRVYTAISVRMPESLPEPDIVVALPNTGMMPFEKTALVAEISDTTLGDDLRRKAAFYAREGIPEYWVIDLVNDKLHRHTEPGAEGYRRIEAFAFGETVNAVTLPGVKIDTSGLLD